MILADRTGRVTRDYRASGAYLVPVGVVVGEEGQVTGRRSGAADLAAATLAFLERARPLPACHALKNDGAQRTLKL